MQGLTILSPKRDRRVQKGWEAFFPYYAGYPEIFVDGILRSAGLNPGSVVLDPWNGSGTTTSIAARHGFRSIGYDLNPVMVVIARARLLPASEADALEPILQQILDGVRRDRKVSTDDPLANWFHQETVADLRSLERSIRKRLVGKLTLGPSGVNLGYLSSIAAAFYVALFAVSRSMLSSFQSTNPTWVRVAKTDQDKLLIKRRVIYDQFKKYMYGMIDELSRSSNGNARDLAATEIAIADSRQCKAGTGVVDLVLTSPPYCTRIDYTAATRVELAILGPFCSVNGSDLSRDMVGSIRVPQADIEVDEKWGETCCHFLRDVKDHPSKASSGYYLKTHLDYFNKMATSMRAIREALKEKGQAILVVQDSFYKELHNDLPTILSEMGSSFDLKLRRREDFNVRRSMSGLNPSSRNYSRKSGAVESVLCFEAV
ncbi:DNA methyltransferase [Rhizobium sp. GR12]|uniref:DNA methyltransferase n=1 Tax=Rhizobium sp. GR12 TaxID=3053925 RepID=UPI002FBE34F3